MQHAIKGMEEFAHHGDHGLHLGFPPVYQLLIEGPDIGIVLGGNLGWHEQSRSEVTIASATDAYGGTPQFP